MSDKLNCAQLATYNKANKSAALTINWNNGTRSIGSDFVVSFETVTNFLISGEFSAGNMFVNKTGTITTANTPDNGGCTNGASLSTATLTLKQGTLGLIG